METFSNTKKPSPLPENGVLYPSKHVPHVMLMPDGSKPVQLGSGAITSLLGIGGMANVYEIWNSHLELKRAVKLLHPNYSEESKQRFETEIKITAKLDHPNIVEIHTVGEWNGLPYIEMEKIDGVTLEKLVSDRGGLPFEVGTSVGIMICRALRYAHNHHYTLYGETYRGIIHRDLKPGNIMVTNEGNVKLMDFGIARPIDASLHTIDNSSVMGTMQYLSPELLEGKTADIRTDIYSLGAILYELVTGVKAFSEANFSKLMISKARNEFKSLDSFSIKIPCRQKRLIEKCMDREREKRPQDAAELLAELTKIHKGLTPLPPEAVMQTFMGSTTGNKIVVGLKRRIPKQVIAFGLLAMFLIAGVAFMSRFFSEYQAAQTPAIVKVDLPPAPMVIQPVSPARTPVSLENASPEHKTKVTFIDELKNQFGASDIFDLFVKEIELKRFVEAAKVFKYIPHDKQRTKIATLYRIRMYEGLGDRAGLEHVLLTQTINDGEFFLSKAKYFFNAGNSEKSLACLDECLKHGCEILNQTTLRQEAFYYRALCYSKEFDNHPSRITMKNALDSWFEVKLLFRPLPGHAYYKKTEKEMQRIGDVAKKFKD
jgi:serine/threonine protein kinase